MSTVATRRDFASGEQWQYTTLGQVAQVKGGKRLPKGEKFADTMTSFPYLRVADFANFSIDTSDLRYLTPEIRATIARYTIGKNDVYISIAGSIGVTGMIPARLDGANLTENAAKLVLNENAIDPCFLMYYLASEAAQTEIRAQTVKNAQPKLALARIASLGIPLPPLFEQQKIAAVLGLVQRAIEQQERLIALTTELKKALLHKLFTEGLRGEPQKQTEISSVPESWEIGRLADFCVLQRGFDITKKEQIEGNVPVISSGGIASYHNVAKVKGPGVVVGRKGTLGKVHYIDGDYWPHDTTLWVKDFKGNDPLFTSYFLQTLRFERYNSGASNPTLNRNTVHAELIAYPRREEQVEIGRILKTVEDKTNLQEHKRQTMTELFRTLLHQLMTAQIRVTELDLSQPDCESHV